MKFFLLALINIFLIFLIRFFLKRNILIFQLAYISALFQVVSILVSLLRTRNLADFRISFIIISIIIIILIIIPILGKKILTEKKQNQLKLMEENFKSFFLSAYDNLLEKNEKLQKIFDKISERITKVFCYLIFNNRFHFTIIIPWGIFLNLFFFETILSQEFILAPYFFTYVIITYRLVSLLLYISKNHLGSSANEILRLHLKNFFPLEIFFDFKVLQSLVLNEKNPTKEEKLLAFEKFNNFLHVFIPAHILKNVFYVELTELKKLIDIFNFVLVLSVGLYLFFEKNFIILASCLLVGTVLVFAMFRETVSEEFRFFCAFNTDIKEFIGHFKFVLINDHRMTLKEVDDHFIKPVIFVLPVPPKRIIFSVWGISLLFLIACTQISVQDLGYIYEFCIFLDLEKIYFFKSFFSK